jgi:hypothetical protein
MVAKAIVARKSLGPKRPYGFESHPRHTKKHRRKRCFFGAFGTILIEGVMMQKTVGGGRREEGRF